MTFNYSTLVNIALSSLALSSSNLWAAIPITAADIGTNGYVITAPGNYKLAENVLAWTPTAAGVAAITIAADGVNLDLNHRTIAQANATTQQKNPAIHIKDASNIKIHDGTLKNLSGPGIYFSCEKTVQDPCNKIKLNDLEIINAGGNGGYTDLDNSFSRPFSGGIVVFGKSFFPGSQTDPFQNNIKEVSVDKVDVSYLRNRFPVDAFGQPTGGLNGLNFISVSDLKIERSSCHDVYSTDAGGFLFLGRTIDVEVRKFDGSDVTGERNANGVDSMMNTATINRRNVNVLLVDSNFTDINVPALQRNDQNELVFNPRGNEALGVEANAENFIFRRVDVKRVINNGPYGNRAIGIQVAGNSTGLIQNCRVDDVKNSGVGFAVLQTAPTPPAPGRISRAGGIAIDSTSNVIVKNCKVDTIKNLADEVNIPNPPGGKIDVRAYGFQSLSANTTFVKCQSEHVTAPNFDFNNGDVGPNTPNGHYVAGFALDGAANAVAIDSSQSKNNMQGLFVRTTSPVTISSNLIKENDIGIKDISTIANSYQFNKILNNTIAIQITNLGGFADNNIIN